MRVRRRLADFRKSICSTRPRPTTDTERLAMLRRKADRASVRAGPIVTAMNFGGAPFLSLVVRRTVQNSPGAHWLVISSRPGILGRVARRLSKTEL